MKKRILVLLTVVALLVVMLAMSVAPAFAHVVPCTGKNPSLITVTPGSEFDDDADGRICRYDRYDQSGALLSTRFKDDHAFPFGH